MADYKKSDIEILCEEAYELEGINRAMERQIRINKNRIAEIDKILVPYFDKENKDE